jgi:hypothetical protein
MKGVEISQRTTEKLERETRESIERIRRDFERLAAWILTHRLARQRGAWESSYRQRRAVKGE